MQISFRYGYEDNIPVRSTCADAHITWKNSTEKVSTLEEFFKVCNQNRQLPRYQIPTPEAEIKDFPLSEGWKSFYPENCTESKNGCFLIFKIFEDEDNVERAFVIEGKDNVVYKPQFYHPKYNYDFHKIQSLKEGYKK